MRVCVGAGVHQLVRASRFDTRVSTMVQVLMVLREETTFGTFVRLRASVSVPA